MKAQSLCKLVAAGVCLVPVGGENTNQSHREHDTKLFSHIFTIHEVPVSIKYISRRTIESKTSYKNVTYASKESSFLKPGYIARIKIMVPFHK